MIDTTHSGGTVVLQVTLAPGVEPSTLSALTVRVWSEKSEAECMHGECSFRIKLDGVQSKHILLDYTTPLAM